MKMQNHRFFLGIIFLTAFGMSEATSLFITGEEGKQVITNATKATCAMFAGGAFAAIAAGGVAAAEKSNYFYITLDGYDKDVSFCAVGPLWVKSADENFCIAGAHGEYYDTMVVPTGAIWRAQLVPKKQGMNLIKQEAPWSIDQQIQNKRNG